MARIVGVLGVILVIGGAAGLGLILTVVYTSAVPYQSALTIWHAWWMFALPGACAIPLGLAMLMASLMRMARPRQ